MKNWIISQTGQGSKILIGSGLLAVGGLVNVVAVLYSGSQSFDASAWLARLQLPAAVVALLGVAYLCISVRCPRCGAKWIWMAISGRLSSSSTTSLLDLQACPRCEFPSGDKQPSVAKGIDG